MTDPLVWLAIAAIAAIAVIATRGGPDSVPAELLALLAGIGGRLLGNRTLQRPTPNPPPDAGAGGGAAATPLPAPEEVKPS